MEVKISTLPMKYLGGASFKSRSVWDGSAMLEALFRGGF